MTLDPYILGLWCADGYYWSSSVGISSVSVPLVKRFADWLLLAFPQERLRLRVYLPIGASDLHYDQKLASLVDKLSVCSMKKCRQPAYHLYVNSRPLLREFLVAKLAIADLEVNQIPAYMAGRFDGDGSMNASSIEEFRITYTTSEEAEADQRLLRKLGVEGTRVYRYEHANTYVLYVKKAEVPRLIALLQPHSEKLRDLFPPRRD